MSLRAISLALPALLAMGLAPARAAERGYIVTDFDSLRVEAPIAVVVETGRGTSARGTGDRDLLDRIELNVTGRVLTVRLKASPFQARARRDAGTVRLVLTVPGLRSLQLTGAGTVTAAGLDRARAQIIAAGSGAVTVTGIATDRLDIAQLGAGSVHVEGRAQSVELRVTGNGALDATALEAADLKLTLEGNAMVDARASRAATIIAVGAGNATVSGRAACTVRHVGSGLVRCGNMDY